MYQDVTNIINYQQLPLTTEFHHDFLITTNCDVFVQVDNVKIDKPTKIPVPGYTDGVDFGILSLFAYPIEDSHEEVVVSTTRLETILGDTAIAVHPNDTRYTHLIGRKVWHPLCSRSMPIIADSFVDREFGTGKRFSMVFFFS